MKFSPGFGLLRITHGPRVWPTELACYCQKGKKASAPFSHDLGIVERAAFQAALLRRTYHRLHHNPDRFPNRSLYSVLRSSEMTTTIEIRTCLSMSPAKMMQLGMHSTSHERQILKLGGPIAPELCFNTAKVYLLFETYTLLQTPTSLPRPSLPATFAIMTWNNPK